MSRTVRIKHRIYEPAEAEQILTAYRTLFPVEEITPALRAYLGWDRQRTWSHLTTNFHAATPHKLLALHEAAVNIERRCRVDELTAKDKGNELLAAAISEGVGFSMGFNPWTDNLLWRTFDPDTKASRRRLVVVVGHDWYPLGAGKDPESPMLDQGLHWTPKYHGPCPEAFFNSEKNAPTVFFLNLFPDFREPDDRKMGAIKDNTALSYPKCVEGLAEVLRILAPKFENTSVISWGGEAWRHMLPLVEPQTKMIGVKKNAQANPGRLLKWRGYDYLAISHPSMPNQVEQHLRGGFAALGLGRPMFDLKRSRPDLA
ncbi:hypothetical protein [Burkholderia sp. Bp8998]|uniref:hypothetical protein n=1 Tax=Burkholderia sp. Bp8998 TaxID=2184557 RepID=UPI000F59CBB1|nr:hypothetical protein [Burkholderia sp. Bp8998]RQS09155.1 hypothetical protein DIE06_32025 [Burkholderia sp. Bp8998]